MSVIKHENVARRLTERSRWFAVGARCDRHAVLIHFTSPEIGNLIDETAQLRTAATFEPAR